MNTLSSVKPRRERANITIDEMPQGKWFKLHTLSHKANLTPLEMAGILREHIANGTVERKRVNAYAPKQMRSIYVSWYRKKSLKPSCFGSWLSRTAVICLTCKSKDECAKEYWATEQKK